MVKVTEGNGRCGYSCEFIGCEGRGIDAGEEEQNKKKHCVRHYQWPGKKLLAMCLRAGRGRVVGSRGGVGGVVQAAQATFREWLRLRRTRSRAACVRWKRISSNMWGPTCK
jgi:hypothetical protein